MNLLSLQDVSKQYEHKVILNRIVLHISEYERIAIVGKNGSGKSSLLNIIAGQIDTDSGERINIKHLKILSLHQKPFFSPQASVKDVLIESMREIKAAHERLEELHSIMAQTNESSKETSEEYERLSTYLSTYRGWDLQALVDEILTRFELESFKDRLANALSGGEQKRIALASLLLQPCDILLLDEPTNHLDVQMVQFLESFLLQSHLTLVFISHDRYFIDKLAQKLLIFEGEGKITQSSMLYSEYLAMQEDLYEIEHFESTLQTDTKIEIKAQSYHREDSQNNLKKPSKLSYKESRALQSLPNEIECLEKRQKELQDALSNPHIYEQYGISTLAAELAQVEQELESKITQYLLLEEKNAPFCSKA